MGGEFRRPALKAQQPRSGRLELGLAGFLFFQVLFLPGGLASDAQVSAPSTTAVVSRVIDGDTFVCVDGEHVRLLGINAPEYEPWKGRIDFYGKEAREYAIKLMTGRKVRLEFDVELRDKYGRLLAYVYLENGLFVNRDLVEHGCARARYYAPNGRYYRALKDVEAQAKSMRLGLWSK